jgi:ornithine carbamoyltransferase
MMHFLRLTDLTTTELASILELSTRFKSGWKPPRLDGSMVLVFEKPSTRTRVAFATGAGLLGLVPISVGPDDMQLSRGETWTDTARALSQYAAIIVVRTYEHERLEEFATAASVPVINALTNDHHPCQALADLLTIQECFGRIAGVRAAFIGDCSSNIGQSFVEAAALAGMHLKIAAPADLGPGEDVMRTSLAIAKETGATIEVMTDPTQAVRGAEIVYPEIWVPMDRKRERAARVERLRPYQVNAALMGKAENHAKFLHCLPAFRGEEVTSDVLDGASSVVWQQAANRLPTQQAMILSMLTSHGVPLGKRS